MFPRIAAYLHERILTLTSAIRVFLDIMAKLYNSVQQHGISVCPSEREVSELAKQCHSMSSEITDGLDNPYLSPLQNQMQFYGDL
jgi:hypothetical protein